MLYECWSEIVSGCSGEIALRHPDLPGGWTFSELDQRARELTIPSTGYATAHGDSLDFFPTILAAWKKNLPVLILESYHTHPMPIHTEIPTGTALIKQTCGASGVERSLFFGEHELLAEGRRNRHGLELDPSVRGIAAISLAHSYGFGCLALPLLLEGIPVDVLTSPLPVFIQQALEKKGRFFLPGVPALWKTWWLTKALDGGSIHLALSAGAPLSSALELGLWNDTGIKLHNFYGTTETGAVAYDTSGTPRTDGMLVGKILDGVEVTTSDDGRILVKTNARAMGSDSLLSADEFSRSHYQTMDLGQVDGDQLFWHDHVGQAINVAGRKVSPDKIKRVCLATPGVIDAEVTSTRSRDYERFEEVSVKLRLMSDHDLKPIKHMVYERLESWEVPRHWELMH